MERIKEVKSTIDSIKSPDDINKIRDFKTYLYTTLLESINVDTDPDFYAYVYLSNFDINTFKIKTEDLITVYDAFSSDELDFGNLILSDGTVIKFTDHSLNEKLNNKDVKNYIKTFVGERILLVSKTATQFVKDRDPILFIKEKGQPLPTKVDSGVKLISSLSDKPITDMTPFNILFEYGYFLDKNQEGKSSLTLSKTWPKGHNKDLEDKEGLMVDYVFKTFSGDKEDFFKYNKKTSFDDANKFNDSIPPILHGLNINTITNTDVKAFIQKNYEKVGGLWIFKPDLQLYSTTFKGFDKFKFAVAVEQTVLMTAELKLNYRKGQAVLADEVAKLEAEKAAAEKAVKKAERALFMLQKSLKEQEDENKRLEDEEKKEVADRIAAAAKAEKDETDRLKKEQEEWNNLSYFQRALKTISNATTATVETATSAKDAVVEVGTNIGNKVVKGVILVKDVAVGNVSASDGLKITKKSLIKTANYYASVSLSETELKYFDTYVGVQFDYFNELDVNVENPFGLSKFSDFYKKYDYGTKTIPSGHVDEGWIFDGPEWLENLDLEERDTINFIASFNAIFSPSIMSKPLSNAYYDVESGKLLYNYEGIRELEN